MNAPEQLAPLTPLAKHIAVKPLRIALLGYRSHPHVGGQGIYLKYLSRALHAMGHHVEVISGPPYPELDAGIKLIKLPSLNLFEAEDHVTALRLKDLRSFTNLYEWWTMLTGGFGEPYTFGRRLKKFLKNSLSRYDIIHDNQSLSSALVQLERRGFPIVATVHHPITRDRALALSDAPNWQHRLLVRRWYSFLGMQKSVTRKLRYVVTVSLSSQKDIEAHFGRCKTRTTVVPNGIDTQLFSPNPNIPKVAMRLITTASSDQPLKGLKVLLLAMANLLRCYPTLELVVIGKLDPKGSTQKLLDELRLTQHVQFKSGLSDATMVEEYNRASIAICPSLYEGFGLPAGEAMSCGLAVVSSDGGALPEVVGEDGIIVQAGCSDSLANAIQGLLDDPVAAKLLGLRARQRILDRFCWQKVACDMTDYYHQLIEAKHANHQLSAV